MALTRKQAWRRVRVVRHEAGAAEAGKPTDDAAARRKRPAGDWMRQTTERQTQQQQQQQHGSPERHPSPATTRADRSDSSSSSNSGSSGGPASPERNVLDNWRLPREGRDPSARPGVSAARRQAAAACVRVGSRVSFNTVVAAILIPSAKDLHAAAREELWWQETDYRDFRINFIQFMRTPPAAAADGPELVPVEIVAESESTPGEEEDEETVQESVQQPVVVDPAVYEGARATEKVCAWPVQEEEDEPEDAVVPATAAAAAAAAAAASTTVVVVAASKPKMSMSSFSLSDSDDTSPPTPPSEEPGTDGGESDESIETAAGISCAAVSATSSPEPPPAPSSSSSRAMSAPSPRNDSTAVGFSAREGDNADSPGATAAAGEGLSTNGGDWDEQETNRRSRVDSSNSSTCSLGWSSMDDEGNDADEEKEEEPDCGGNTIRMGRSFSNLETARRGGAGLSAIVAGDSSDGDESSDDSEMGGRGGRPRALSLDGWFTCGLENGVDTKSYETHDHAGRLRDLVLLAPIPAVCATQPTDGIPNQQVELNDALRRLGVAFNVSVDKSETPKASDESAGTGIDSKDGEPKRRAEGGKATAVSSGLSGFGPSPAAAAASRKMATLPSPVRPRPTALVKSQQRVALDRGNSLTTPVDLRVS